MHTAFTVAGTGSAGLDRTADGRKVLSSDCRNADTHPSHLHPLWISFFLPPQPPPPSVSDWCYLTPYAPWVATYLCSVWMQTWIIGFIVWLANFLSLCLLPPVAFPYLIFLYDTSHLTANSFPVACCTVSYWQQQGVFWSWIIGLRWPCQPRSHSIRTSFRPFFSCFGINSG